MVLVLVVLVVAEGAECWVVVIADRRRRDREFFGGVGGERWCVWASEVGGVIGKHSLYWECGETAANRRSCLGYAILGIRMGFVMEYSNR